MGAVQPGIPALLAVDARQRACAHRPLVRHVCRSASQLDRHYRSRVFPAAAVRRHGLHRLPGSFDLGNQRASGMRAGCRMAGEIFCCWSAFALCFSRAFLKSSNASRSCANSFPTRMQVRRARLNRRRGHCRSDRKALVACGRIGVKHEAFWIANMAPMMFAAMVLFMLLGYPAAFSLGAVGLFFGLFGIEFGLFPPDFLQPCPIASMASSATTRCWRFRSSPLWARFSNVLVWRKTCSIHSVSSSDRARRPRVRCNFRRRPARRDHRCRGSIGHRHGRDLHDADAEIRLLGSPPA